MSLPAALTNTLLYALELNALKDVTEQNLLVYKEDSEPGEGRDPHWAEKGDLDAQLSFLPLRNLSPWPPIASTFLCPHMVFPLFVGPAFLCEAPFLLEIQVRLD